MCLSACISCIVARFLASITESKGETTMKCISPLCWIGVLSCSLSLTAVVAGAQSSPGAYPSGYIIILDTQDRTGSVHYATGADEDLSASGPLDMNNLGAIDLAPSFGRYDLVKGHLEVTYHFRVRYTASNWGETPQSSFSGMVSNVMRVSAISNSTTVPSVASVRPDGGGSLMVSVLAQFLSSPGIPGFPSFPGNGFNGPGAASDARTSYTGKTVNLSTPGIDTNGSRYSEGTVQLKVVLDISASAGTAEAHDQMTLSQAKTVMISRSKNQGLPLEDDGTMLQGVLEADEYNADGSSGKGDSRYNNNIGPFGHDFGNAVWAAALVGSPWPYQEAFLTGYLPLAQREWHWYDSFSGAAAGHNSNDYTPAGPDGFAPPRPWHAYPFASDGLRYKYIPTDVLDEMQNAALPTPDVSHVFFHLIDTDTSYQSQHPEWNFDKTANFYVTFHNRYEEASNVVFSPTPVSENPWHLYHTPTTLFQTNRLNPPITRARIQRR